jgi:hypothetical protein
MNFSRFAFVLIVLACSASIFAQKSGSRGAPGGGAPAGQGHAGGHTGQMPHQQQHLQHITPEMQQMHHYNQTMDFWGQQMMVDMMMQNARSAARNRAQHPHAGTMQSQPNPSANQGQQLMGARHAEQGLFPLKMFGTANATKGGSHRSQPQKPQAVSQNQQGTATTQQPTGKSSDANRAGAAATKNRKNPEFAVRKRWRSGVWALEYIPFAQDQGIINLLKLAHAKLLGASEPYAGRRDRALDDIATAAVQLSPSLELPTVVAPNTNGLAQPDSDQVLREVLHHLDAAETSLRTIADPAERHEKARTAVVAGMNELNTALGARQGTGQE